MIRALKLFFLFSIASAPLAAEQAPKPAPTIPYGSLLKYSAGVEYETLESMQLKRLLLNGPIRIRIDPFGGYSPVPAQEGASIRFQIDAAPQFQVDLLSLPKSSFPYELNDQTLNAYVDGMAARQAPERAFTVISYSDYSPEGASKFRILSRRARQIIYEFTDPQAGRMRVAENWVEIDGYIHIVKVQAPASHFEFQLRIVGDSFSSASRV